MRYFIRLNPSKKFVQKLYRLKENVLHYYGEQGGWHHSFSHNSDVEAFIKSEFTEEVSEGEMMKYITDSDRKL